MDYNSLMNDPESMRILSRILAHLMGDGCVTNRYFAYYNKDSYLLDMFQEDVGSLFGNVHFIKGKMNSGTRLVQIQNKQILIFLRSLIKDYRSGSLKFPKFIVSKDCKREFLRAIYDDEGNVGLRIFKKTNEIKRSLTIASKSKKFMKDLKNILEKDFGIQCNKISSFKKTKDKKIFTTWYLSITGKANFIRFRDNIGFKSPKKNLKLKIMANSYIRK